MKIILLLIFANILVSCSQKNSLPQENISSEVQPVIQAQEEKKEQSTPWNKKETPNTPTTNTDTDEMTEEIDSLLDEILEIK